MATRQPRAPSRRTALALCLAPCLTLCAATAAQAQAPQEDKWPTRPVRIVVGFPAGSFTDTIARALSEPLSKSLGQPVVVENKPGSNGAIGVGEVARAAPDGYTLLVTNSSSITINPQIYKKITYRAKDFAPITMVLDAPFILTVNPEWAQKHQIRSAKDVIAFAKGHPDKLSYGSAGPGKAVAELVGMADRKSTRLNSSHLVISYAVFCLKKQTNDASMD